MFRHKWEPLLETTYTRRWHMEIYLLSWNIYLNATFASVSMKTTVFRMLYGRRRIRYAWMWTLMAIVILYQGNVSFWWLERWDATSAPICIKGYQIGSKSLTTSSPRIHCLGERIWKIIRLCLDLYTISSKAFDTMKKHLILPSKRLIRYDFIGTSVQEESLKLWWKIRL